MQKKKHTKNGLLLFISFGDKHSQYTLDNMYVKYTRDPYDFLLPGRT